MQDVEPIVREVLIEGLDDWVMMGTVIGHSFEGVGPQEDFKTFATRTFEYLFVNRLMEASVLGETGFEACPLTSEEALARVVALREGFNWAPRGAGCWLSNTPAGDERATAAIR